jgi:hypothetical protein
MKDVLPKSSKSYEENGGAQNIKSVIEKNGEFNSNSFQ